MKTSTFMTVAFLISMVFAFAASVLFWWTYRLPTLVLPPIKSDRVDVSRVADDQIEKDRWANVIADLEATIANLEIISTPGTIDWTDSAEFTNPVALVPLALFLETKDETFVEIHYGGETLELSSRRVWDMVQLLDDMCEQDDKFRQPTAAR